ncbi:probable acyl-[acyl-carrier-protein]--UDP-N-acetylglucosamine O-acyltransferase, mitochondrial isoform X1 [Tanacetum coccineum]
MLEENDYESWKIRIERYIKGKTHEDAYDSDVDDETMRAAASIFYGLIYHQLQLYDPSVDQYLATNDRQMFPTEASPDSLCLIPTSACLILLRYFMNWTNKLKDFFVPKRIVPENIVIDSALILLVKLVSCVKECLEGNIPVKKDKYSSLKDSRMMGMKPAAGVSKTQSKSDNQKSRVLPSKNAKPTEMHLHAIKRIFRYLKGTLNMGLWYPKDSGFALTAFADADYAGCFQGQPVDDSIADKIETTKHITSEAHQVNTPQRLQDKETSTVYGVSVGPFCIVGPSAVLGNNCKLHPRIHVCRNTELGDKCILMSGAIVGDNLPGKTIIGCNNVIGHHVVVGIKCQEIKYKAGNECFLEVGDNNEIREHVSIHRSSKPCDRTVIGDNNLIIGSCHIAHDCKVGSNNIFANNTLLAGHVLVEVSP